MRLRLRLVVDGGADDVEVEVDPLATIGELAVRLARDLPDEGGGELGLVVDPDTTDLRILAPDLTVGESGLRSGLTVSPTRPRLAPPARRRTATLHVHDGPDAPASFPIANGVTTIGRGRTADVTLTDPLVSKRHARLVIGGTAELVDDSSANGIVMSGRTVDRVVLRTDDRVLLGGTTISVTLHANASGGNELAFNRSPRVDPRYQGVELVAPEPPRPPGGQRFPIVSLVAPLLMAGMIYAVTRSTLSILFVALSPIMMVGSWAETKLANRKQLEHDTARFRAALADLTVQLRYAQQLERTGRRREHPSPVELLEAVEVRSPLVWTRRPEHDAFATVRLGLGTRPSRTTVAMPTTNQTLPDLWRELQDAVAPFATVDRVPVVADVASCGNIGVAGPDTAAAPVLRGLIAQYVALHSPTELAIAAVGPTDAWEWMKWLPHVRHGQLAGNGAEAAALVSSIEALVDDRLHDRIAGDDAVALPIVVLVVHDAAPADRARLVQLAERAPQAGVSLLWYAPCVERLPAACRAFVDVDATGAAGQVGFVADGVTVTDLRPEPVGADAIGRFARQLSPLVDAGAVPDVDAELPREVALVDLAGHDLASEPAGVVDRWRASGSLPDGPPARGRPRGDRGLRALVGQSADGPLHLDLRADGPHALVGGTTGSGKSEFLQTWILGMAAVNSPARVTFLLVDYKGGAAFADCVHLPHCVGLVTDLSPHLVRRALTSLDAEVRHREQLLHDRRAKDLVELERRGDPDCPPSLVIVVDEFAALVADVPDFVDGVVNVAQRGRSLGIHLVLATQRPAGVITDSLRANTNLRIALRVADVEDSLDVVGVPDAALVDPERAGRAIVKRGPGRVGAFQAAYVGGHHAGIVARPPIEVRSLRFGSGATWDAPEHDDPAPFPSGSTDLRRIVGTITTAARSLDLTPARRPWLPELAVRYRLEALPTERTDRALVIGVADEPERQAQPELVFRPDRDGNLAVFGTGGAGTSTCLRTITAAAGFAAARGGPCWVYGLDFGTRGLHQLEALPHVGSIVHGDDPERLQRLVRMLRDTIDDRSIRFARANAATIHEYRERAGDPAEPRILLLVDGVGTFRSEYEGGPATRWWDLFTSIAADGRSVGVHVVVTADRPTAVPSTLASTIQRQIVLRLANQMDYALADAPADAFGPATPPGRGFVDGREVQLAVIGGSPDVATQAGELARLAASMGRAGVATAPPIGALPERVVQSELPAASAGRPVLGLCDETLGPIGVEPTGTFLVTGPPHSGTSTTVATLVRSIVAVDPTAELVLLGSRRSPLASVAPWAAIARGESEVAALASRLASRLAGRDPAGGGPRLVVVVEAIGDLLNTDADLPAQDLLRACRDADAFVIAEGETSGLTGSWPLLQAVKVHRSGVVLQPDQLDGESMFKTPFPRIGRGEYPAGRGLMVQGGRVRKVQVALPE